MKLRFLILTTLLISSLIMFFSMGSKANSGPTSPSPSDQARLSQLLEWVYQTMVREYYLDVSEEVFESFKNQYTAEVLYRFNAKKQQTEDYIHLGAGLLVQKIKGDEDLYSNFIPPKKTKEFKEDAYAARRDLGIKGNIQENGFLVTKVQKHSDAYKEGLRYGDIILSINDQLTSQMDQLQVEDLLNPEEGSLTKLLVYFASTSQKSLITLESKSYFIETVFQTLSDKDGVLIMRISQFNQRTSQDVGTTMNDFGLDKIKHLILDLTDNQGGPPLATKEIMGYFAAYKDPLFFILRKNRKPFLITAPEADIFYDGPITVLVNEKTASAAETLSGVLRVKRNATVIGRKTAGASYLKSMYDYEDGSSLMLVTSRTFFHNGKLFPAQGLIPDKITNTDISILEHALNEL